MIDTDRYDRMAADIKIDVRRLTMLNLRGIDGELMALTQAASAYEALAERERKAALDR